MFRGISITNENNVLCSSIIIGGSESQLCMVGSAETKDYINYRCSEYCRAETVC